MKKKICAVILAAIMTVSLSGCETEADRVSYNVSQEADNFNVIRRLTVLNARTDKPMFEADVQKYYYEVNFLPEMIIPITFTSED